MKHWQHACAVLAVTNAFAFQHIRIYVPCQNRLSKSILKVKSRLTPKEHVLVLIFPFHIENIKLTTLENKKKTEVANDTQLPIVDYVFKRKTPFAVSKQQSTQGEGIFYLKFNCFWQIQEKLLKISFQNSFLSISFFVGIFIYTFFFNF